MPALDLALDRQLLARLDLAVLRQVDRERPPPDGGVRLLGGVGRRAGAADQEGREAARGGKRQEREEP